MLRVITLIYNAGFCTNFNKEEILKVCKILLHSFGRPTLIDDDTYENTFLTTSVIAKKSDSTQHLIKDRMF